MLCTEAVESSAHGGDEPLYVYQALIEAVTRRDGHAVHTFLLNADQALLGRSDSGIGIIDLDGDVHVGAPMEVGTLNGYWESSVSEAINRILKVQ
jgi:hypothetical protein